MTYAARWAGFWSLVGAVGVGLSFLVWRPLSVVTVFLTATLCAGVLLVLLAPATGPHSPMAAVRWARICARAGLAGAAVVALGAVSTALPAVALPLALAALATSPAIVDHLQRWRRASAVGGPSSRPADDLIPGDQPWAARPSMVHDGPAFDPQSADDPAGPVGPAPPAPGSAARPPDVTSAAAREMTDADLCRQWRRSFVTLQSAQTPGERARVVAQRQVYLDELERRSPTALQAWLASGARAAGGPDRFLTRPQRDDQSDAA